MLHDSYAWDRVRLTVRDRPTGTVHVCVFNINSNSFTTSVALAEVCALLNAVLVLKVNTGDIVLTD